MESCVERRFFKNLINTSAIHREPSDREEDSVILCGDDRPLMFLVLADRERSSISDRNDAFFGSLTDASQKPFSEEQVSWP